VFVGLALWNSDEFQLKVCGSPSIPVEELKKQTRFTGGDDNAAAMFWKALGALQLLSPLLLPLPAMEQRPDLLCLAGHYHTGVLTDDERSALLKFVTGRIRLPVQLKVEWSGGDSDLLPTSATCYQAIYMPQYATVEKMVDKLKIAALNCMSIDTD